MGILKSLLKVSVYPYTRTAKDVLGSGRRTLEALREAQALRAKRLEEGGKKADVDAKSGKERFAAMAAEGGWTRQELSSQKVAVRRGRWASLLVAAAFFVAFLGGMWRMPFLVVVILAPVLLILVAASLANAARMAWYEFQLESASLVTLRQVLSRPDLFRRVLSW